MMKMPTNDKARLYPVALGGWCCVIPFAGLHYFGAGADAVHAYNAASANVFRAMSRNKAENDAAVARSQQAGWGQGHLQAIASGLLELRNGVGAST